MTCEECKQLFGAISDPLRHKAVLALSLVLNDLKNIWKQQNELFKKHVIT